ncbi:hypothetical protein H9L14_01860 [Sphingomonas sediminicola]|uniref:Membrane protein 6-pyruvoyl-tetrahydropterin synthase-related domain-containing protein n=1 Tax=Sphingomonas sediminicola TaxID=386874 RepID=A0ABX6T8E1_9SPHN|nr:hypothetical protein [Sphingomonas sediminicola]QNP46045.1 hypothetical protein H9L14_01860 [Sphingomonas sediminicola]
MARIARGHRLRHVAVYLLFVGVAALLMMPAVIGPPMLYDSFIISWVWADQFTSEIARGNLYPRWLPLSNSGLGSPVFYYYPPIAFYVTAIFGLLGVSTYASVMAAFWSSYAMSGITAWHWLKERSSRPVLGALMFVAAPYHLFDFSRRGALAETVAISLIPLLAIGLRRIAEGRGIVLAALAYGVLICTHLPLALLASTFLIAPYALWHRRELPHFALACGLGIGFAAIYLGPALTLERHREAAMLYRYDFLRPEFWSIWSANLELGFVATVFLLMASLTALAVILIITRRDKWAFLALGILVISAGVVPAFWSLPLLAKVQFPYRALPIAEFALVTAVASARFRPLLLIIMMPVAYLSATFLLQPRSGEIPTVASIQADHPDLPEYLPPGVMALEDSSDPGELARSLLPPPQVPGKVVEPHFYFPAWSCGEMHPQTKLLMHNPGCSPRIVWTREERVGALITLLSLAALAWLGFRQTREPTIRIANQARGKR